VTSEPGIPNPQSRRAIRVAVPVPQLGLLTYSVPDALPLPPPGARVVIPLGSRKLTGCVVAAGSTADHPADRLKDIVAILDCEPYLPQTIVDLALWTADYYAAGPGEALAAAMPPLTRRADAFKTIAVIALTVKGREVAAALLAESAREDSAVDRRTAPVGQAVSPGGHQACPVGQGLSGPDHTIGSRQRAVLEFLAGSPVEVALPDLHARRISLNAVRRLKHRGLISLRRDRVDRDPFTTLTGGFAADLPDLVRALTPEQESALARLTQLLNAPDFRVALLHGVTGSGKTEIYLRLAEHARARGRGVLLMVPEIALTPAAAATFRGAFGNRMAIQHSGLSDGERHDQWHRIRRGEIDVVIGTRSAVFTPMPSLGLIIVDEEHDASYKQDESPRYNARDVAVMRGKQEAALVVLGSATPSMESYHNADAGRYERVVLSRRVLDRPLARVRIIDMRQEFAEFGPDVIIGSDLKEAIESTIARHEQVLLLLNRRGFSTSVFCRQCAGALDCPNCSVSLTVHDDGRHRAATRRARCHYCNYSAAVPKACPRCAGPYLEQAGFGTERVEAEVAAAFPAARVARLDRDSIRRRGALGALLGRFGRGDLDVLVGTQMVAKGHDFPRVTLVGVISADVGLGLADFRAAERTFQLLTQVAGRAGRGERAGEAIVQTLYPDHYSIRYACRQDYPAFFREELKFRQAMRYPPVVGLVNGVVRARTSAAAMEHASAVVQRLRRRSADETRYRVLGPAPAPLTKLRGEHRAQFFMKGTRRGEMRKAIQAVVEEMPQLQRHITIDVDPLSVL
jgi:primosomal protein N' (replication factor Y)